MTEYLRRSRSIVGDANASITATVWPVPSTPAAIASLMPYALRSWSGVYPHGAYGAGRAVRGRQGVGDLLTPERAARTSVLERRGLREAVRDAGAHADVGQADEPLHDPGEPRRDEGIPGRRTPHAAPRAVHREARSERALHVARAAARRHPQPARRHAVDPEPCVAEPPPDRIDVRAGGREPGPELGGRQVAAVRRAVRIGDGARDRGDARRVAPPEEDQEVDARRGVDPADQVRRPSPRGSWSPRPGRTRGCPLAAPTPASANANAATHTRYFLERDRHLPSAPSRRAHADGAP